MKIRIIKGSSGDICTYTWRRYYSVQIRVFILWREISRHESIEDAKNALDKFGRPREIVFKY